MNDILWENYLSNIPEHRKKKMNILLENQKLFIEQAIGNNTKIPENYEVVYEFICKVFDKSFLFDLVQVHPLLGPVNEIQTEGGPQEIVAKTRKLDTIGLPSSWKRDLDYLSTKIANQLTREVIKDLKYNSGTVATSSELEKHNGATIYLKICEMFGVIVQKTGERNAERWVYTSPSIASKLTECGIFPSFPESDEIIYIGLTNGICKIFVDPEIEDVIICGINEEFRSLPSYLYCPYIPFTAAVDSFSHGLMIRYGKKLCVRGSRYYGVISFKK